MTFIHGPVIYLIFLHYLMDFLGLMVWIYIVGDLILVVGQRSLYFMVH